MKFLAIILLTASFWSGNFATEAYSLDMDTVTVEISGTSTDARFDPALVEIEPGDVLRFVVTEGLHTVTAYHPDNRRPLRMPEAAEPFDSGLLEAGDEWTLQLIETGVYDYFCLPHERMGHVGRIISGAVDTIPDYPERIPDAARKKLTAITSNHLIKQTNK